MNAKDRGCKLQRVSLCVVGLTLAGLFAAVPFVLASRLDALIPMTAALLAFLAGAVLWSVGSVMIGAEQ